MISSNHMNFITPLKTYLLGSVAEMRKVTWPTKEQTINYSLLVIGLSLGLSVFFAVLDNIFNSAITTVLLK